ncbi:MAG TPA: hypothetical protein VN366_08220 [Feifaniaceae bacterium]|nr:hypothetical protein [Feifaniaceae bacterium]
MDFVKSFKRWHIIAASVIAAAVMLLAAFGALNTGVDYAGGTLMTINLQAEFEENDIAGALNKSGVSGARVQTAGDRKTLAEIRMQYSGDMETLKSSLEQSLAGAYPGAKVISAESVTAAHAGQLFISLFVPAVSACAIGFLYAWVRYGLPAAISAGLTPLYSLAFLLGVSEAVRVTVNTPFVGAALLTAACSVIGVCLLFERLKKSYQDDPQADKHRKELTNAGIRGSIPGLLTLFCALAAVLIALAVFGGASLWEFALPGVIGLVGCALSAIFLAAPLWAALQDYAGNRPAARKKKAKKTAKKK